jgi:hypothetical protein
MSTTTVHCDRCLERIETGRLVVRLETGPARHEDPIDLCDRCTRAFLDWLKPGAGGADHDQDARLPPRRSGRPPRSRPKRPDSMDGGEWPPDA